MAVRPKFKAEKLNFKRPNDEFATLQNVEYDLRTSDGDFANLESIAIEKRLGTQDYGNDLGAGASHSLISYTNNTFDYLVNGHQDELYIFVETLLANSVSVSDIVIDLVDGTDFATSGTIWIGDDEIEYTGKIGNQLTGVIGIADPHTIGERVIQREWLSVKSGLSGDWVGGVAMASYSGASILSGTVNLAYTGTWTAVDYNPSTGFTRLTDNTKTWQADDLIGRQVKVNTGDFADLTYTILNNGTDWIEVEDNIVGGNSTSTTAVGFTTVASNVGIGDPTITLASGTNFPTTGGTINIENDIITYTSRAAAVLSGVSGISIGHPVGAITTSGDITLADAGGFDQNGGATINGDRFFFNNKAGNKLLNISSIKQSYPIGATVTDDDYKTATGKSYEITFVTTSSNLIDTTANWTDDQYADTIVVITGGKGVGQQRRVTSNTQDNMVIGFPWEEEPDDTSTYDVYDNEDQILYMGNGVDNQMRFDGTTVTELPNIPKGNIMMEYKSRLFIADPESPYTVKYSDPGDPEYFPLFFTITPPGDDKITGLGEWNGNGIIFKERSIWKFNFSFNSTTSIFDVDLDQIPSNSGCVSHRSIQKVENVLWYFDGTAVKFLGASPNQIGVIRTEEISFPIQDKLSQIPAEYYGDVVAAYDDNNYLLFTRENSDSITNDYGYDYDSTYSSWSTRTGNNAASIVFHDGKRFYGDAETGQIFEMDVENYYNDGSEPIDMIVETKDDDMNDPALFKTFRFAEFGFENEDGSVEYVTKVFTTRYTLTREGVWDIGFGLGTGSTMGSAATLGLGAFGASGEPPRRIIRKVSIGLQGTRIQHQLRNRQLNEKITITDVANVWYAKPSRHFPSVLIS
jgi:hypothetical protein